MRAARARRDRPGLRHRDGAAGALRGLVRRGGPAAMILGLGTDLCNIERIDGTVARFGDRFLDRVFTEVERRRSDRRHDRIASFAKRWAAKEACSKALGTGLRMGIKWRDMGTVNLHTGQPTMVLTGWAADRLHAMTPPAYEARIHVTITDDHPWAQAVVAIEAVPEGTPPLPRTGRG